jgi:hypothetical protein
MIVMIKYFLYLTISIFSYFLLLSIFRTMIQSSNIANDIFSVGIISFFIFILVIIFLKELSFPVFQGILVGHLISFIILSSTLVNFDRSRSVQVLLWAISNQEVGLLNENVADLAYSNGESELSMSQRLNELKSVRIVTLSNDKWYPTALGRLIYSAADISSSLFRLRNYEVMLKLSRL